MRDPGNDHGGRGGERLSRTAGRREGKGRAPADGKARIVVGRQGEALAEQYLTARGYRVLARRFRLRNGEIDLVMADGDTVVFIEVRTRRGSVAGDPLESVHALKQSRLIRAARLFLAARGLDAPCRFDVVAVRDHRSGSEPRIDHRIDAFRADGPRY